MNCLMWFQLPTFINGSLLGKQMMIQMDPHIPENIHDVRPSTAVIDAFPRMATEHLRLI